MKRAELIRNVDAGIEMPHRGDALSLGVRASVALLRGRGFLTPHGGVILTT